MTSLEISTYTQRKRLCEMIPGKLPIPTLKHLYDTWLHKYEHTQNSKGRLYNLQEIPDEIISEMYGYVKGKQEELWYKRQSQIRQVLEEREKPESINPKENNDDDDDNDEKKRKRPPPVYRSKPYYNKRVRTPLALSQISSIPMYDKYCRDLDAYFERRNARTLKLTGRKMRAKEKIGNLLDKLDTEKDQNNVIDQLFPEDIDVY